MFLRFFLNMVITVCSRGLVRGAELVLRRGLGAMGPEVQVILQLVRDDAILLVLEGLSGGMPADTTLSILWYV